MAEDYMTKRQVMRKVGLVTCGVVALAASSALAEGIVSQIVSSPLSASGLVTGAATGINVYLENDAARGIEFMDPNVVGYGIPAGGHVEIEMGEGFERIAEVAIEQPTIMVVTGAPQQGLPGSAVGYKVSEGANPKTIVITPNRPEGLPAESLMAPAPGAKQDQVPNRGFKVFHVGLTKSAFRNVGEQGSVEVRIVGGDGEVVESGSGTIDFLEAPEPQIFPNNLPDKNRNHNWQSISTEETLGKVPGTVPLAFNVYDVPQNVEPSDMVNFKDGRNGVGILSPQQLTALEYEAPDSLARYTDGLIVQDSNGDGRLEPANDQIIGGVTIDAPDGATAYEIRSLDVHGAADLSRPSTAYNKQLGSLFGGAVGLLQFTAGDKPGLYRPAVSLMRDPTDPTAGDSSSYTFTVRVE